MQAHDGGRVIDLATSWTRRGAESDARRLRGAFGIDPTPGRARGRDALTAGLAGWDASQAEAKRRIASHYASGRVRRQVAIVLGIFALAYAIALTLVIRGEF